MSDPVILSAARTPLGSLNGSLAAGLPEAVPATSVEKECGSGLKGVASRERAQALGMKPFAPIRSYAYAGVAPRIMGKGSVNAVPRALERAGFELADIRDLELGLPTHCIGGRRGIAMVLERTA